MDPALWEILKRKDGKDEEVEAIIRLDGPIAQIPGVRIISRFGMIATCRLKKGLILPTHDNDHVQSLKAPRIVGPEVELEFEDQHLPLRTGYSDTRRPKGCSATGKQIVIASLDWGLDYLRNSFRNHDGSTRLIALWDQRGYSPDPSNKYGYGTIYYRDQINNAMRMKNPYEALGYHPEDADRGSGAHGTHVMDIAAGNGTGGGPMGIAPESDLIFVHLANRNTGGLANLGDSSRILEALEFVITTAGDRPWVVNLSVGRHGGPHNGTTLCEIAFDAILQNATNRFIVQSAGNYLNKKVHASGRLSQGMEQTIRFVLRRNDTTPNELEIWTKDNVSVVIQSPSGSQSPRVYLKNQSDIIEDGTVVGRIYNRESDPNNGDNHIDIFLYRNAPKGEWKASLKAEKCVDGIFHAWLERDDGCAVCQSRFIDLDADAACTTGTLANGHLPLVVGAYNAHRKDRPAASFSSVGPTRDGRAKPDLVAPGVAVLAARSSSRKRSQRNQVVRKSGTSMAAPHVTGAVALCLEASGRPLTTTEIRSLILDNLDKSKTSFRYGGGYLNILKSVQAAKELEKERLSTDDHHHKLTYPLMNFNTLESLIDKSGRKPDSGRRFINELLKSLNFNLPNIDPERIYRAMVSGNATAFSESLGKDMLIVGRPGEALNSTPRQGDLLIRVALGEPGLASVSVLSDENLLLQPRPGRDALLQTESRQPGAYAVVVEAGTFPHTREKPFARRLLDGHNKVLSGQILLRLASSAEGSGSDIEGQLIDEEPFADEVSAANLQAITHAGRYPIAYDRLTTLGVIEPMPGRNKRKFKGTAALQTALDAWAPFVEKVMQPPVYILTGGLHVEKPGEHGNGNAIDVDGFWWSDADVYLAIDAPKDWYRYLTIEATLRKVFGTVLNYDYNLAHHDHWHCDLGTGVRWRAVRSQALFAQRALNVIWGESLTVDGKWGPKSTQAALRQGYNFSSSGGWDRFLDNIINRQSTPPPEEILDDADLLIASDEDKKKECPPREPDEYKNSLKANGILDTNIVYDVAKRELVVQDFGINSAVIPQNVTNSIDWQRCMSILAGDPGVRVAISGYSDCAGSSVENISLRKKRAASLKAAMPATIKPKVLFDFVIDATSYLAPNDTAENRARNRAVKANYTEAHPSSCNLMNQASTIEEYIFLIKCAEDKLGLTKSSDALKMLSMTRQLYYGSAEWSVNQHRIWDAVIEIRPWSTMDNPLSTLHQPGKALQNSNEVMVNEKRSLAIGHLLAGIDAMISPHTVVIPLPWMGLESELMNEEWATWAGDVGSAVGQWAIAVTNGTADDKQLERYYEDYASESDLLGDIEAFGFRQGLNSHQTPAGNLAKPIALNTRLSELLRDYFCVAGTPAGRAHQNVFNIFVQSYGGEISGKTITNKVSLHQALKKPVDLFAHPYTMAEIVKTQSQKKDTQTPALSEKLPELLKKASEHYTDKFIHWLEMNLKLN